MSFAIKKSLRSSNANSFSKHSNQSIYQSQSGVKGSQSRSNLINEQDIPSKIEFMEFNLNNLCSDNDKLIPLLNLAEYMPLFRKNEDNYKDMQKKMIDNEKELGGIDQTIIKLEGLMDGYKGEVEYVTDEKEYDLVNMDKQIKITNNHLNALHSNLKDVENTVVNLQTLLDRKFGEETNTMKTAVENKLKKNKKEIQNVLKETENRINDSFKNYDEQLKKLNLNSNRNKSLNEREELIEEIQSNIQNILDNNFENLKTFYQRDLNNLNREIGILKCEFELLYEKRRSEKINNSMKAAPKDLDYMEKKIKLNNTQQTVLLKELDEFNNDNTQRILYELHTFEDKLESIYNSICQIKNKPREEASMLIQELEFLDDRYNDMKYQIEGVKKKYIFDTQLIEDKYEKIKDIKDHVMNNTEKYQKRQRIIPQEINKINIFPDHIQKLTQSISTNLDKCNAKIEKIDEKIHKSKGLLKQSTFL